MREYGYMNENHWKYDLSKHFSQIYSYYNLAQFACCVVDVNAINIFENHVDKHWFMQDFVYGYQSKVTGIGNRSFE